MSFIEHWKKTFVLSLLAPPLGYYAERMYQSLPPLTKNRCTETLPSLSIIVPARNEAENLQHLLPSLQALRYDGKLEVIVVDDNSADETAVIAQQYDARVIRLTDLPPGWLGKPHAICHGASAARGDWLLFTDADTIHAPNGPEEAVRYAVNQGLDGLSLFLEQECRGVGDRLALMAAFAGLFTAWKRNSAYLNGQYMLIRRDVYEKSGGITAVRHEALEDVALGHHLQKEGYNVQMMRGEKAAKVRMYQDNQQMWHGMNRLGSQSLRFSGLRSLLTVFFITIAMNPLLVFLAVISGKARRRWLPLTWGAVFVGFLPWAKRYGSFWYATLSPIGALIVQVAGFWGLLRRAFRKGINWKGRMV
jgi:chlorobactene glucosyltransferase